MQVAPDWSKHYPTGASIDADLKGFKFNGPGLYCTSTNTVLVQARLTDGTDGGSQRWHQRQPDGTTWDVHTWNLPIHETILAAGHIPTRQDATW